MTVPEPPAPPPSRHPPPDVFYPLVPEARWVSRLGELGVKTLQLRYKSKDGDAIDAEVRAAATAAKAHNVQLIINDHWQAAIRHGAPYVHLGQEDLAAADVAAIKAAGIGLGLSTHSVAELATALAADPDYVALGPIYETRLKKMTWAPQGLERVAEWRRRLDGLPLVAIGGLTPERAEAALDAGASSVAVITDIFASPHPEARVALWLEWAERRRGTG